MDDYKKDHNFVAATTGSVNWIVDIEPSATSGGEVNEEMLNVYDKLLDIFGNFILPLAIECDVGTVPTEVTISEIFSEFESFENIQIYQADGVTAEDIRDTVTEFEVPNGRILNIRNIEISDARVCMQLKQGNIGISRTSREIYKTCRGDEVVDKEPAIPPVGISIIHNQTILREPGDEYPETTYSVRISSSSEIWVGESDIAETNRHRLGRLLADILDAFEIVDKRFHVDNISISIKDRERLADLINENVEVV